MPKSKAPEKEPGQGEAKPSKDQRRQGIKEAVAVRVRQPEWVLAAAVLICLPMLPGVLSGSISIFRAMVLFLIALIGCWAGGAILSAVLRSYGAIPDPTRPTEPGETNEAAPPLELPETSSGGPGAVRSPQGAGSVGSAAQGVAPTIANVTANMAKSSDPMENLQALTQPSLATENLQRLQGHDEPTGRIPTVRPSVKPTGQSADEMTNGT
jgi:hypothetical protein